MKKTLAAALSTTLVLGFAGTALAVHGEIPAETSTVVAKKDVQIAIDGSIRMRGYMQQDTTKNNANATGYDGRVQLGVAAKAGDAVKGYLQLETWNGNTDGDSYAWGGTNLHSGGATKDSMQVLQAWIDYNPNMFGVKVGHMPIALGNRLFLDHTTSGDDAILAYLNPTDNTHVAFMAVKFEEGANGTNADDLDMYAIDFKQKLGGGSALGVNVAQVVGGGTSVLADMSMTNIGVNFDGKFGDFSLLADVEFQLGDYDATTDQEAYAAKLGAKYKLGAASVGALVGYGSGDDGSDATTQEEYTNFLADTVYDVIVVGYRFAVPGMGGQKNTSLANMLLAQINGDVKFTCPVTQKPLTLKAAVSQMTLNEMGAAPDDDLGVEVDLWATWKLSDGLAYKVEFGYLMAGDAWGANIDDPFFLRNTLEYKF